MFRLNASVIIRVKVLTEAFDRNVGRTLFSIYAGANSEATTSSWDSDAKIAHQRGQRQGRNGKQDCM